MFMSSSVYQRVDFGLLRRHDAMRHCIPTRHPKLQFPVLDDLGRIGVGVDASGWNQLR
jgi:hypothetical protein